MTQGQRGSTALLAAALVTATIGIATGTQASDFVTTVCGQGSDAKVRGGQFQGDNFGFTTCLNAKNSSPISFARKSYVRFDLSTLDRPAASACLKLSIDFVSDGGFNPDEEHCFFVYGLNDAIDGEQWNEGLITWINAPANDTGSTNGVTEDAQLLGGFCIPPTVMPGDAAVLFSSEELLAFLNADSNDIVTFIITGNTVVLAGANFASRESPFSPPTLFVGPCTIDRCQWDCANGNGVVDIVDFLGLLSQWGQVGTSCDFNGCGVDVLSFLELLANWGPCP